MVKLGPLVRFLRLIINFRKNDNSSLQLVCYCLSVWFQAYLEQIANYIRQNTGIDNKVMDYDPNFCDPFTGSGRYVPSSDSGWYNIL